jgi:hypothetical protein
MSLLTVAVVVVVVVVAVVVAVVTAVAAVVVAADQALQGHLGPWTVTKSGFDADYLGCYYYCYYYYLGVSVAIAMTMRIYAEWGDGNVNYFVYDACDFVVVAVDGGDGGCGGGDGDCDGGDRVETPELLPSQHSGRPHWRLLLLLRRLHDGGHRCRHHHDGDDDHRDHDGGRDNHLFVASSSTPSFLWISKNLSVLLPSSLRLLAVAHFILIFES